MHRRTLLELLAASALFEPLASCALPGIPVEGDDAFLDDIERRACLFFTEQSSPNTGQVLDRARNDNSTGKIDSRRMASVSATGFGLGALCIADRRG